MKTLFQAIADRNGTSFYTGAPLRNRLLGIEDKDNRILVHGVSSEELVSLLKEHLNESQLTIQYQDGTTTFVTINDLHAIIDLLDYTIDSICINAINGSIFDPKGGMADLKGHILRCSKETLLNNPIKLLEIARLSVELQFNINTETWYDVYDNARLIKHVPPDVLKNEISNILLLPKPSMVFRHLKDMRILNFLLPELAECERIIQSKRSGVHNVFEHVMYALDAMHPDITLRLVMLFHDIAKPETLVLDEDNKIHFFNHEQLGAKHAKRYLRQWGFPKDVVNKVSHLVLHHMFDADPRLTDKSVRRLIRRVGKELIYDLLAIREADRLGTSEKISMKKIRTLKKKIDREIDNV